MMIKGMKNPDFVYFPHASFAFFLACSTDYTQNDSFKSLSMQLYIMRPSNAFMVEKYGRVLSLPEWENYHEDC